ncbi:hypothetical protein KCP76_14030 [Salmonella enterica subsp. enterica serovar Weltevreden]|nr:hypothetical protein KCP76_14030 [Salmonella enterica subsp. enterica serovar Weltevreden]
MHITQRIDGAYRFRLTFRSFLMKLHLHPLAGGYSPDTSTLPVKTARPGSYLSVIGTSIVTGRSLVSPLPE